ncbi:MAG: GGDEF domain-containing protein [Steroidobacteraceae bacterium]
MSADAATGAALDWARALLLADTWPVWLEAALAPPGGATGEVATLLVADPTHGLRRLLAGESDAATGARFVDGLGARAPALEGLHDAWSGGYRAADHGLLFAPSSGASHVLVLPLRRAGRLVGVYSVAGHGGMPMLAGLERAFLSHLALVLAASAERVLDRVRLLRAGQSDPVTGWNPARHLQARLGEEISRCQRHGGSVACVVVDVDGLRAVNERHGQAAGDRALDELASRIEAQVRSTDACARLASDEFAVVLPQTRADGAIVLAERVLAAVAQAPVDLGEGLRLPFTVSVGIAAITPDRDVERRLLVEQLLADAAAALARAKLRGGSYEVAG